MTAILKTYKEDKMHYEINVAKKMENNRYRHLFATHARSIKSDEELKRVYPLIREAFPQPEYQVTVIWFEETGYSVDKEKLEAIMTG